MNRDDFKIDLLYLLDELDKQHISLYYSTSRKEILDYIDKLLEAYKFDTFFDQLYIVKLVIKRLSGKYDQHMKAMFNRCHRLPLRFTYINRNLYLIDTLPEYKEDLYKKVASINGIDITTILREYFATINNDIPSYKNYLLRNLCFEDILMLPSIDSSSKKLYFKLEDGKEIKVDININYHIPEPSMDVVYKQLSNFIYIKFPTCMNIGPKVKTIINKIRVAKDRQMMDYLVIDLRDNLGGNSLPLQQLAQTIKQNKIKTYVAVNGGTFSAASINAYDLKLAGATLVGEEMGEQLTCFGNFTKEFIVLPTSKISVRGTTKFFYPTSRGVFTITNKKDFKKLNSKYKKILYLDVDHEIKYRLIDYKENKDIVMKYIINTEENNK